MAGSGRRGGATALGAIQFLNPTAHWPCLALTTVLVALLARTRRSTGQLVAAGILIGTIALFRQLTGFFVGVGALTYLIARSGTPTPLALRRCWPESSWRR